jgi:curved DNA-binding protein
MVQVDGRRLRVKIPPGAKTGTKVRMANAGPTTGLGNRSDLYLVIKVTPDKQFDRKKDNLYTEATIDLYTVVLGGQTEVNTPGGKVILTIPAGTQPDQTFRLAGRGMPKLKNPKQSGDLYVRVKVQIPKNLTKEQQDLFEKLRRS